MGQEVRGESRVDPSFGSQMKRTNWGKGGQVGVGVGTGKNSNKDKPNLWITMPLTSFLFLAYGFHISELKISPDLISSPFYTAVFKIKE